MKYLKLFCVAVGLLLGVGAGFAQSGTTGSLNWSISGSTLTISGNGAMPNYASLSYTSISTAPWYDYHSQIERVVIEDGVTNIGDNAFWGCSALTSVTLPSSIITIGTYAFATSVTIVGFEFAIAVCNLHEVNVNWTTPTNIPSTFGSVIANCCVLNVPAGTKNAYKNAMDWKNFKNILESGELPIVWDINSSGTLIGYYGTSKDIVIPSNVTSIGDNAFLNCVSVTSISVPENVTSIGNNAFSCCTDLSSITIPSNITSIENKSFYRCISLSSITIPSKVASIGDDAFAYCISLASVIIPDAVTNVGSDAFYRTPWYSNLSDGVLYIGRVLYKYKGTMPANTTVNVRNGTVKIANNAFEDRTGLVSITIPSSATSIGSYAFSGCRNLTSVSILNGITNIGNNAFYNCSSLTSITIPNSVTTVGTNAFYNCKPKEVTIPDMSNIYTSILTDSLRQLTFMDITTIGATTFSSITTKLKELYLPNTLTSIATGSFSIFTNLTSLTLPFIGTSPTTTTTLGTLFGSSGVSTTLKKLALVRSSNNIQIANNALSGLSQLTEITLSSNVRGLGEKALYGCNGLEHIYSEWANPPSAFNNSTFDGVNKYACVVHVPIGAKNKYVAADGWKEFYIDNIQEEAAVTITAHSVPLHGGIISGALQYNYDDNASITANGNMGYDFQGWMENDNIVSTNRTYTFTVEGARTLYAVFTPRENDNAVSVSSPSPTEAIISWNSEDGASSYTLIIYSDAARTQEYARFGFNADGTLRARNMSTSANRFSQTVDNLVTGQQYYYTVTAYDSDNYKLSIANGNFTAGSSTGIVETQCIASLRVVGYYSILGQKLPREPEHGLYIILYDNGKSEKIMKR